MADAIAVGMTYGIADGMVALNVNGQEFFFGGYATKMPPAFYGKGRGNPSQDALFANW
jgi:hypothetical protein